MRRKEFTLPYHHHLRHSTTTNLGWVMCGAGTRSSLRGFVHVSVDCQVNQMIDTLWPGHPGQGEESAENHSTSNPLWFTEPYPSMYSTLTSFPWQDATQTAGQVTGDAPNPTSYPKNPRNIRANIPHRNNINHYGFWFDLKVDNFAQWRRSCPS